MSSIATITSVYLAFMQLDYFCRFGVLGKKINKKHKRQGHSDRGCIGIYIPKSVYLIFYVVVLSP